MEKQEVSQICPPFVLNINCDYSITIVDWFYGWALLLVLYLLDINILDRQQKNKRKQKSLHIAAFKTIIIIKFPKAYSKHIINMRDVKTIR